MEHWLRKYAPGDCVDPQSSLRTSPKDASSSLTCTRSASSMTTSAECSWTMGWPLRRAKSTLNYKKRAASTQRSSKSRGRRSSPRSGLTRIKATPLLQTINQGWWNASLQWRRDDLFAAIPPLESRRAILAICGAREAGRHPYRIMALDVARAYFDSPASMPSFVRIHA